MTKGLTLLLSGDVMLGRGIDQILARPGDPTLAEHYLHDARRYVELAEEVSGRIPRSVDDGWPWGAALEEIAGSRPAVLVVNLETGVTTCSDFAPDKGIHYRMSPENVGALRIAHPDVCVLANNHVMDFGRSGLADSLRALHSAGLAEAGAGTDLESALAPAVARSEGGQDVAVFAVCHASSGVPYGWAAAEGRSGVALLPDLSARSAESVARRVRVAKQHGDVVVLSVHWGSNWGYNVPKEQVRFAHWMIEAGVDVVHGHSSHHPRPLEVYDGRLILYGCGDFINDYEGIAGHEDYRGDLRLLYRVRLAPDGALVAAEAVPFQSRRLRLERALPSDVDWLAAVLDDTSIDGTVRARPTDDHRITLDAQP